MRLFEILNQAKATLEGISFDRAFDALAPEVEQAPSALRDKVYGVQSTDHNWNACKARWLTRESTAWLKAHADRPLIQG